MTKNVIERIEQLSFNIEGDVIYLEQESGLGTTQRISFHAIHLRHLAEKMGGCSSQVKELERRIAVLCCKIEELVCDEHMRKEICERIGYGFEFLSSLDALYDLALEYDGGRLEPGSNDDAQS